MKLIATRDRKYEAARDLLIPAAEQYANQMVPCDRRRAALAEDYRARWTRVFMDRMKELATASGLEVAVPLVR